MSADATKDHRLREALAALGRGWIPTPLDGKVPVRKRWTLLSPPTVRDVEQWIGEGRNIGVRTGATSGIVVIDEDTAKGGSTSALGLPRTATVLTGGGGRHFYFRLPRGVQVSNSAGKLAPHVDVRGEGGQVVYPGSIHPDTGQAYAWAPTLSPDDIELAELPQAIVDRLTKKRGYVDAAFENELNRVKAAAEGERNAALNRAAFSLGQLVAAGKLAEDTVVAALLAATALPHDEALTTIRSGIEAGTLKPRSAPSGTASNGRALSDLGNAERLVDHFGVDLRFATNAWGWMAWDGRRWARDEDQALVMRAAFDTVRRIHHEAANVEDGDERKAICKHALQSERGPRLREMISLAAPYLHTAVATFDRDPLLLNVENGTLDLRTGELRPHAREDFITKLAPVRYDPEARCPRWRAFLDRILDGDDSLYLFLRRALGYSLTGETGEHCLFFAFGTGANGKSTFLETARAMLGDYGAQADFTTFLAKSNDSPREDLASLNGARFVASAEVEAGRRLAEVAVKQFTGGDTMRVRFLHRNSFEFKPAAKLWWAANHKPTIRGTDHGIWRRIHLLPFTVQIPVAERDPDLKAKLAEELPGILAWAVKGCLEWQQDGLAPPPVVVAATAGYREEMDTLAAFLAECCEIDRMARIEARDLYGAYKEWASAAGEPVASQRALGMRLAERGLESTKSNGRTIWLGVRLTRGGQQMDREAA